MIVSAMSLHFSILTEMICYEYSFLGTTWTQEILSAICNEGDIDKVNKMHSFIRVPFMEKNFFKSTEVRSYNIIVYKIMSYKYVINCFIFSFSHL